MIGAMPSATYNLTLTELKQVGYLDTIPPCPPFLETEPALLGCVEIEGALAFFALLL
jgi:hypothetical protein